MYMLVYYICINVYKSIILINSTLPLRNVCVEIVLTCFFIRLTLLSTSEKAMIQKSILIGFLIFFDPGSKILTLPTFSDASFINLLLI